MSPRWDQRLPGIRRPESGAAISCGPEVQAAPLAFRGQEADAVEDARDESLTAEAWKHGHAEHEVDVIEDASRDDMLGAHRTPPQLIGVIPQNNGGFGSVREARDSFYELEIVPIARRMLRVNDWADVPVLSFADYICADGSVIRQEGNGFRKIPAGQVR